MHASSHKVTHRDLSTHAVIEWFAVIFISNQHPNILTFTEMTFWIRDSRIHSGNQVMSSSHILFRSNDSSCLWITPCLTNSLAITIYSFYGFPMPPHLNYSILCYPYSVTLRDSSFVHYLTYLGYKSSYFYIISFFYLKNISLYFWYIHYPLFW
jgi:hypothetical protein